MLVTLVDKVFYAIQQAIFKFSTFIGSDQNARFCSVLTGHCSCFHLWHSVQHLTNSFCNCTGFVFQIWHLPKIYVNINGNHGANLSFLFSFVLVFFFCFVFCSYWVKKEAWIMWRLYFRIWGFGNWIWRGFSWSEGHRGKSRRFFRIEPLLSKYDVFVIGEDIYHQLRHGVTSQHKGQITECSHLHAF